MDLKKLKSWREGATLGERARLGQAQLLQEVSDAAVVNGSLQFTLTCTVNTALISGLQSVH